MSNIGFAKTGLQLQFTGLSGGGKFNSDDHCKLLINLCYNNPDDNFYIIGQNDLRRLSYSEKMRLFPHDNVFDALGWSSNDADSKWSKPVEWLNQYNVNLEYAIIGGGPTLNVNVPFKIKTSSGSIAKPLTFGKRGAAPVIHTLNETGVKWVGLADDPRCLNTSLAKDLFNKPEIILSQVNKKIKSKHIQSYENQELIEHEIEVVYCNIEMACNLDEIIPYVNNSWKDRETHIGIVLNEAGTDEKLDTKKLSNGHRPRYPILKNWLLDIFKNCCVYGKWDREIIKSNDSFRGFINRDILYPEMKNWKHSLCVPIDRGWATAKYLEYLKCGISPFMHPEYDEQKNTNVQDFYRVNSVEELKDKIAMSEDTHIEEINKAINNCLSEEYVSGQKINDEIYSALGIERNIKNKLRDLWTPQKTNNLEGFMNE